MQIMVEKGLPVRDASTRPQVFTAAEPHRQKQAKMVRHLVDCVFRGVAGDVALHALSSRRSTRKSGVRFDRLEADE